MANSQRGEVAFLAGDSSYTLSFSINALCELEDALGDGVNAIAAQLGNPGAVRIKTLRAVLWAGLLDHHDGLSIDDAGRVMTEAGIPATMAAIGKAFAAAFPDAKPDAKANGSRPPKAGTGSRSAPRTPAPALTPSPSGE